MGKALDTEHCLPLVNEIADSVQRNPGALVSLARLKTSDAYTFMHSVAVCALMVSLARQLQLSEAQAREAGMAGLVHDMGKALMPLEVLNKPGALTQEEFAIMKSHPEEGYKLLKEGGAVGPVSLDVCLHHHEKVNGRGYPKGLKGDEISLYAKMGAVCDVYDAITSNRPYKAGWDPADSLMKMAAWTKEGHFDERVFQAFVKSIGIYPTGSLVKLQSGRLAVVVEQGASSLLSPIVRVFFSTKSNQPIPVELLDLGKTVDQIVSRVQEPVGVPEPRSALESGGLSPPAPPSFTGSTGSGPRVHAAGGSAPADGAQTSGAGRRPRSSCRPGCRRRPAPACWRFRHRTSSWPQACRP